MRPGRFRDRPVEYGAPFGAFEDVLSRFQGRPITVRQDWVALLVSEFTQSTGPLTFVAGSRPDLVRFQYATDVILIGDIGKLELLAAYPRLYTGSHVRHGKVEVMRAARVSIRAERGLAVEGDGDMQGGLPATFEVLRGALRVIA